MPGLTMKKTRRKPTFADQMPEQEPIPLEHIEAYVLGALTARENRAVEAAASSDPSLRARIEGLQGALEHLVRKNAVTPPVGVKQRILEAVADQARERSIRPPVIHGGSKVADFAPWIEGPGMLRPADAGDIFFIPFAENADGLSVLVWLVSGSPEETHTDSIEKFLIVEGSCHIVYRHETHVLKAGDVFSIPLHTPHTVKVTSAVPCKIILQRIAA